MVCSIGRSPDFSTVTTEGEVREAQRLLKPVRDSEVDRCAGQQCVYTSCACERYNVGLRIVTLVILTQAEPSTLGHCLSYTAR